MVRITKRFFFSIFLPILFGVLSCEPTLKVKPLKPRQAVDQATLEQEKQAFEANMQLLKTKKSQAALRGFVKFLDQYPTSRLADDAYFRIGGIHRKAKRYDKALNAYKAIVERYPTSNHIDAAKYYYGAIFNVQGKLTEAMPILESVPVRKLPEESRLRFLKLLKQGYQETKQNDRLLKVNLDILEIEQGSADIREEVTQLVQHGLDSDALESLASKRRGEFPSGYALMKLAHVYFHTGNFNKSKSRLKTFLSRFRDAGVLHPLNQDAEQLLMRLDRLAAVKPGAIGVLLPLSGPYEGVGRRILNGILLASKLLSTSATAPKELRLFVRDTAGNSERAVQGMQELVLDYQVAAVIGPALKRTSSASALAADAFKVPTIVMSQEEGVAKISPYVFQNCLKKSDQVRALVRFATQDLKSKRFALLYPEHAYGQEMFWLLWEELNRYPEVDIRGVESYEKAAADFGPQVRRLAGLFYLKTRGDELCKPKPKKEEELTEEDENCFARDELPPIVDFETLIIPDSADKVRQIAPALSYYGIRGVQLLGGNLWNNQALLEKDSASYLQGATFVDGFYLNSKDPRIKEFVDQYRKAFKQDPDILAAQAYDTMSMLTRAYAQGKLMSRDEVRRHLIDMPMHQGASGTTSFSKQGEAKREIYFFTIDGRAIRPLLSEEGEFPFTG